MPELRWTLLILGALFIGALALWELRRQRHARGSGGDKGLGHMGRETSGASGQEAFAAGGRDRISPTMGGGADFAQDLPARGVFREPTLTLPEVQLDANGDLRDRDRISNPRVVELDEESIAGLKVDGQQVVDEFSSPMHDDEPDHDERAAGEEEPAGDEEPARLVEPMIPELSAAKISPSAAASVHERDEHDVPTARYDASVPEPERVPTAPASGDSSAGVQPAGAPIVDWPPEESRKIIAVRLVSGAGERFQGRAVRLALAAEGFLIGKFEIFHKPGPDSRAVLSAASLTKPGTFSLDTMDAQRFGGISLFAVLPGPLSPVATFDELLTTARSLNDRLRGALQDERGEPLTPIRSTTLRDSLAAAATAAAPVVGAARSATSQAPHGPDGAGAV
ncbi:MAG: cell division protein ZipA C-terminal FtsZ-binding domain-containing protein [Gammaproteobacteria bacterium]